MLWGVKLSATACDPSERHNANSVGSVPTHFVGTLPYGRYVKALQVSAVHPYLTYSLALSWSLLEAMAYRANVVAADVAPVREFAQDGAQTHLVDGLDPTAVASRLLDAPDGATTSLARKGDGASRIPAPSGARCGYERGLQSRLEVAA